MPRVLLAAFVTSLFLSPVCRAEEAPSGTGWADRIYFSLVLKSAPFDFNTQGFKAVYNDGYDDYDLSFDTLSLSSAGKIGLQMNSILITRGSFRSDVELGLNFISADKLYGGDIDVRSLNGVTLGKRFFLTSRLSAGGGLIKGVVSKVTKGNNTGADFMLGPKGEHIPEGNEISVSALLVTVSAGAGMQVDLFSRLFADVFADYIVYGNGSDWDLVADDADGKSVTLDRKSFSNIADLKDVDLGGLSFGLALGWRL
jgi:hypothetical protein